MYEKAFQLEIVAPDKVVFKEEATSFSAPGVEGGFQVLFNHAPFLSILEIGQLKVRDTEGREIHFAASGGFVEVRNNSVVVLVESAERADEIDVERAKAARARAEKRLKERYENIDLERANLALLRALNRIRVAART